MSALVHLLVLALAGGPPAGPTTAAAAADTAARGELGFFLAPLDTVDSEVAVSEIEVNLEAERAWKVGLEWPSRAYDVAMRAVGPLVARRNTVVLDRGDRTATLVATQLGLADDSIGGIRDRVELALQFDGTWRVRAHWRSYFCPRGPGRGAWIEGPCR